MLVDGTRTKLKRIKVQTEWIEFKFKISSGGYIENQLRLLEVYVCSQETAQFYISFYWNWKDTACSFVSFSVSGRLTVC